MSAYINSSAAVLRWNQEFSSLGSEESVSFPFLNSMFPKWSIAATTRKIDSWKITLKGVYVLDRGILPNGTAPKKQYLTALGNITCSSSLIPTTSIALLVARYSLESSAPSNS